MSKLTLIILFIYAVASLETNAHPTLPDSSSEETKNIPEPRPKPSSSSSSSSEEDGKSKVETKETSEEVDFSKFSPAEIREFREFGKEIGITWHQAVALQDFQTKSRTKINSTDHIRTLCESFDISLYDSTENEKSKSSSSEEATTVPSIRPSSKSSEESKSTEVHVRVVKELKNGKIDSKEKTHVETVRSVSSKNEKRAAETHDLGEFPLTESEQIRTVAMIAKYRKSDDIRDSITLLKSFCYIINKEKPAAGVNVKA